MARRRTNGEGTIDRHHTQECPALVDGKRPKHRCKGYWRARVTVTAPDGRRVRKTLYGRSQEEVAAKMRDLAAADRKGVAVIGKAVTVGQWIEEWLVTTAAKKGWKVNTIKGARQRVNTWLIPHLGHHRLDRLGPEHVERLYTTMREAGKAEGTIRQVHVLLHQALKVAFRWGKVGRNVAELVDAPGTEQGRREVMTKPQAEAVLTAAGDNPRPYVALLCGLRQGEALALRWSDVYLDAPRPFLVVRRSVCREVGKGLVFTTPKSKASRDRVVPLVPRVAARLRALKAEHAAKGWTADPEQLVFCTGKRTPYSATQDRYNWDRVLAKAGVGAYTLHSARNTCAQLLESAGNQPRVVAEWLGHSTVAVTYRYQDGNEAATMQAAESFDQFMGEGATLGVVAS